MSLPAWKKRSMVRSKTAQFEREQRAPFLRELDMQEVSRMTGIKSNASQIINGVNERRSIMINKHLAKYYACKLAAASKRGDYGRFIAEINVLNAEEAAVQLSLATGVPAVQIETVSPDLLVKVQKIESARDVQKNGLALPPELQRPAPAPAKKK